MLVSEINIYPIKSLKGISLNSAVVEERGLQYDRRWMLTTPDGMFFTQREFPRMATLSLWIEEDGSGLGVAADPAALALALLALPLIATLFHHGAFTGNDVIQTRDALVAYSIGLVGLILVKVLAPGFYARQNIRTPVKIALISLLATQAMNLAFIGWLQHDGLALSIGMAACLNAALLYHGLRRHEVYQPQPGWLAFSLRLLAALVVMGGALWFAKGSAGEWLNYRLLERITRLSGLVGLGAVIYFATLWILGFRLGDFKRRTA